MNRLFFLIPILFLCSIGQLVAQKIDLSRYSYQTPFVYKTTSNRNFVEAEVWGAGRSLKFSNGFLKIPSQAFTANTVIRNGHAGKPPKSYVGLVFWSEKEFSSYSEFINRYEARIFINGDIKVVRYRDGNEKIIASKSKEGRLLPDDFKISVKTTSSGDITVDVEDCGTLNISTNDRFSGSSWIGFCTCDGGGSKYIYSLEILQEALAENSTSSSSKIDLSGSASLSKTAYPKTLETKAKGCIAGDCFYGFGYYISNESTEYIGYFSNGVKKGIGQLHLASDNALYTGFFDNDQPNGYGNLNYYANLIIEVGTFANTQQEGKFFIYKNDRVKTGLYQGSQITDIEIKSECLSGDCDNGTGVYQMSNGNHYEGTFVKGSFAKGVKFENKEKVYQFENYNANGTYSGLTDILSLNGEVVHGVFANGKMNGQMLIKSSLNAKTLCVEGTFENGVGTNITVQFRDGRKWVGKQDSETAAWATGTGTMTYPDGTTKTGKFNDGEFISE